MEITRDHLNGELQSLRAQHANALAVAHQAAGAIALIESLMAVLDKKDLTLNDIKDALGAKSAELVPIEKAA